jgi:hypothetical protein
VDAEENAARNTLADMQARLAAGPFAVLAVAPTATPAETRSAFLELTKQFHPARFGRMASDVQRLANEVFLGIKAAHDALAKAGGWSPRGQPNHAPPAQVTGPASGGVRATGGRPSQPAPNTPAAGVRVPASSSQPPTQPLPVSRPAAAPQPATRQTTQPLPQRPATQPVPLVGRVATAPAVGGGRPVTPSAAPQPQPATRSGPATVQPWKPAPASGPARAPTSTAPAPTAAAGAGAPFDERAAIMQVQDLVRKQQWAAARQALQNLAARVPTSTQYKALLAYARGREAQQLGRNDEAILELQRALQLDPNLSLAKTALAEMQSRHK